HIGEIQALVCVRDAVQRSRSMRADRALPVQVLESLVDRGERNHGDAAYHRRFLGVAGGGEEAMDAPPPAAEGDGQDAAYGLNTAVERELTEHGRVLEALRLERLGGDEYSQSHGQVEGRADLAHLGGRQVHGDAVHGELEAGVADGRADAVAALAHRGV